MKYAVSFRHQAETDLTALYDFIAEEAGHSIAQGYIGHIEEVCLSLSNFPKRGTQRDDLGAGLRTIGFERLATIAFRVQQ